MEGVLVPDAEMLSLGRSLCSKGASSLLMEAHVKESVPRDQCSAEGVCSVPGEVGRGSILFSSHPGLCQNIFWSPVD